MDEQVKRASEEARQKAIAKMQAAIVRDQAKAPAAAAAPVTAEPKAKVKEPKITVDAKGRPILKQVKVYSPFRVYFDNPAQSISAISRTGPFDVLPGHKNFMTLLVPCDVVVRTERGEQKFAIQRGVMHVRHNHVTVFLDV